MASVSLVQVHDLINTFHSFTTSNQKNSQLSEKTIQIVPKNGVYLVFFCTLHLAVFWLVQEMECSWGRTKNLIKCCFCYHIYFKCFKSNKSSPWHTIVLTKTKKKYSRWFQMEPFLSPSLRPRDAERYFIHFRLYSNKLAKAKRNEAKKKESHFHSVKTYSLSGRLVRCIVVDILSLCELACYSLYMRWVDGFLFFHRIIYSLFALYSLAFHWSHAQHTGHKVSSNQYLYRGPIFPFNMNTN